MPIGLRRIDRVQTLLHTCGAFSCNPQFPGDRFQLAAQLGQFIPVRFSRQRWRQTPLEFVNAVSVGLYEDKVRELPFDFLQRFGASLLVIVEALIAAVTARNWPSVKTRIGALEELRPGDAG